MADNQHHNNMDDIQKLEHKISELAMRWREQPEKREAIRREYHATLDTLYSLGWDEILDIDCELPEADMPHEYKRRHPYTKTNRLGSFSWRNK
jgi:hypothetical protein